MKNLDHPRTVSSRTGKPPRTVRQQLEQDAWTNHYRFARRMAMRPRHSQPERNRNRPDRILLALSLALLLLLFARAGAAQNQTLTDTRTDRVFELNWKPDFGPKPECGLMPWEQTGTLLPVGSSVNLASFSSTSTGWKAQLAYSLAALLWATSLLWFSTPSRRLPAGGSPPPPVRAH